MSQLAVLPLEISETWSSMVSLQDMAANDS
jgi:hypothetical protein